MQKIDSKDIQDAQNSTAWPGAGPRVGQDLDAETARVPPADPVELALADALQRASVAGAWTTVERLASELEARRRARSNAAGVAPVVTLASARKGKRPAKRATEPTAFDPRQTDLFKPTK